MSFKKCKVVMLPTNEKTNALWWSGNKLYEKIPNDPSRGELNHLYILSDKDEIKKSDWYVHNQAPIGLRIQQYWSDNLPLDAKKIITTTDTSLEIEHPYDDKGDLNFPLPQPSQGFIEKYVEAYNKGNAITNVMIEYEFGRLTSVAKAGGISEGYKLKVNPKDNTITIKKIKDSWSREEVVDVITLYLETAFISTAQGYKNPKQWIEENL